MAAPTKLTDIEIQKIALLFSQGLTQADIAALMGLSQPSASRARRRAEAEGWLVDQPRCTLGPQRIQELELSIHAPGLLAGLQQVQPADARHLRLIRIFEVGSRPRRRSQWARDEYRDRFGQRVAQHLEDSVFPEVATMGVTWGGTLLATIRALRQAERPASAGSRRIVFFPVCGTPPDANLRALRSSSNLVARLDELVNNSTDNENNFAGVAAAISSQFSTRDEQVLLRYFRENEGYARVFGLDGKPGLLQTMDAVMTSVGTSNPQENPWIEGAAKAAGIEAAILSEHTYGNIGGIFLPRPDIGRHGKTIDTVNKRWTGIKLEHYRDCAERAAASGSGGTLLVALGRKADATLACVRRGLVTQLLIDPELAVGLANAIGFRPRDTAAASTALSA